MSTEPTGSRSSRGRGAAPAGLARLACALLLALCVTAQASEWPCYKADAARSGVTTERLSFPLSAEWIYRSSRRPRGAWPEPGRLMHVLDFDYAFQPVVAGGLVFFGSSADDRVHALDARTGRPRWTFTTRAPVRFAPHIAGGRCYFAGDDGFAYCLEAATGKLVWKFRASAGSRMVIGNGRMIARTPCRSGVLVLDGTAYVTAGMWPSEGIYVYALDAETGEVIWCDDTSGSMYVRYPHAPAVAFGGVAPQGYLLSAKGVLLVPCGKAPPHGFDARTGKLLFYKQGIPLGFDHNGGHWATVAGDIYFNTAPAWQPDQEPRLGEGRAVWGDGLGAYDLRTGRRRWRHNTSYRRRPGHPKRIRGEANVGLVGRHRLVARHPMIYAAGRGEVEALDCSDERNIKWAWTTEHPGRVYSMALAGDTVLVGGPGHVTAYSTRDGSVVWRAAVDGRARGLAVAGGRLVVSTQEGSIYSFAPGRRPALRGRASRSESPAAAPDPPELARILRELSGAELARGYALVVGDKDAGLAEALARRTQLHVVCYITDASRVPSQRRRLLAGTSLYGSRVVVHEPDGEGGLPYPDCFANLVVVSGTLPGNLPASELYRVLRPCGGRILFVGIDRSAAVRLISRAKVPEAEVVRRGERLLVVRGKLPGAFDWDSDVKADHRLRWPLELLWFGGPGAQRSVNRHQPKATVFAAGGLLYAKGPRHLTAVDAYNGTELWWREIEGLLWRRVAADDEGVYVDAWGRTAELDARTGRLKRVYGKKLEPVTHRLDRPRKFHHKEGEDYSGTIEVANTARALELVLVTRAPPGDEFGDRIFPRDCWELGFDFRAAEERLTPYGPGAFHAVIFPGVNSRSKCVWDPGLGPKHDLVSLASKETEGGTHVVARIRWDDVRRLVGAMPADFTCSARLTLFHRKGNRWAPRFKAKPFTRDRDLFHNGTATFVIDPARAETVTVPYADPNELPAHARKEPRQPPVTFGRVTATEVPDLGPWPERVEGHAYADRAQPLTGRTGPRSYSRSYGCNGVVSAARVDFFRSGTIGIYDRADDSGMRNFSGIKSGCGMCTVAALGLFLNAEGAGDCSCGYNFATCFALAPAARRRNEDWALFDDKSMTSALTRRAALNLGAPGDRRDEGGVLWLHFPRQRMAGKYTINLPCHIELFPGARPYRVNADRVASGSAGEGTRRGRSPVRGAERPWVSASGYVGIRRITLDLLYYEPGTTCLALETKRAPRIDGDLSDTCWGGIGRLDIPAGPGSRRAALYVRRDAENLYVGYRREAEVDRRGGTVPWRKAPLGQDADLWRGDCFDILFKNAGAGHLAHFGAGVGGGRYDAVWRYRIDVPRLEGVAVDGKADDWRGKGVTLVLSRGQGTCRLAWSTKGLLILKELTRDFHVRGRALTAVRTMVLNPETLGLVEGLVDARRQTFGAFRPVIEANDRANTRTDLRALRRTKKLATDAAATRTDASIVAEMLLPWEKIGVRPGTGTEVACQIVVFNPAHPHDENIRSGAGARRDVLGRPDHLLSLRLTDEAPAEPAGRPITVHQWHGAVFALKMVEDTRWNGEWTSAVRATDEAFTVEMAIPWRTLSEAGIKRDDLAIDVQRGRLSDTASAVLRDFERRSYRVQTGELVSPPRNYTVRLHFAELHGAKPGERVFDVRLQGKVVGRGVDVAREALDRTLVREFRGVTADKLIDLEFVPRSKQLTERTLPILSGIEIVQEGP